MAEEEVQYVFPEDKYLSPSSLNNNTKNGFYVENGKVYFIKKYPIDFEKDRKWKDAFFGLHSFYNEVLIQSYILHPNILPIKNVSIEFEKNYFSLIIITPRCYYGDLSQININQLNGTEKTYFAYSLISALSQLHNYEILHGDIKPGNIFIDEDPIVRYKPYLADFGHSHLKSDQPLILGTFMYKSPEKLHDIQIHKADDNNNSNDETTKSDIFSFGLVLLHLLFGKSDIKSILGYPQSDDVDEIIGLFQKIPGILNQSFKNDDISKLIIQCCDFDPSKRPTSTEIIDKIINDKVYFPGTSEQDFKNIYVKYFEEEKKTISSQKQKILPVSSFDSSLKPLISDIKENKKFVSLILFLLQLDFLSQQSIIEIEDLEDLVDGETYKRCKAYCNIFTKKQNGPLDLTIAVIKELIRIHFRDDWEDVLLEFKNANSGYLDHMPKAPSRLSKRPTPKVKSTVKLNYEKITENVSFAQKNCVNRTSLQYEILISNYHLPLSSIHIFNKERKIQFNVKNPI